MTETRSFGRKLLSFIGQSAFIFLATLLLFEAAFRIYLIDFYGSDFEYLNSTFEHHEGRRDLLIVGDSFSAFNDGYPKVLSDSLHEYNVHNLSVPGTSIREQYLFGRHYLKRENPQVVIFQFYVGNDLLGWNHHTNWDEISILRNSYWRLSENISSLAFLNSRLSGIGSDSDHDSYIASNKVDFDPDLYTQRDKIYFKAEPGLVENAAMLTEGRGGDLKPYMKRMKKLFEFAGENSEIFIVVIPHCAQVNDLYLERMKLIGAQFSGGFEPGLAEYPLRAEMETFFSGDKRVKVLDPLLHLKAMEEKGHSVYFSNDSHLNTTGQKLIGEWLLKEINWD